jgi:hypothetical protein
LDIDEMKVTGRGGKLSNREIPRIYSLLDVKRQHTQKGEVSEARSTIGEDKNLERDF